MGGGELIHDCSECLCHFARNTHLHKSNVGHACFFTEVSEIREHVVGFDGIHLIPHHLISTNKVEEGRKVILQEINCIQWEVANS